MDHKSTIAAFILLVIFLGKITFDASQNLLDPPERYPADEVSRPFK